MRSANLLDSFRHAFAGLGYALRTQRNARIHLLIAAGVVALGLRLGLSRWEWVVIALTIGFVLVAELFNTVVEAVVDLASPEIHPLARVAKDVAAGAVLLAAILSVVIGLLILGPHLIEKVFQAHEVRVKATLPVFGPGLCQGAMVHYRTRLYSATNFTNEHER